MKPSEVILESYTCPFCHQSNDKLLLIGRDRLYNLPGEFRVVKCRTCGLMRTDPRPTPETISFYYPNDYGPYQGTKVSAQHPSSHNPKPLWERLTRRLVESNTRRLPCLPPTRMLEIGCASGSFLHKMAIQGWDVEGLEFSETAAESARSLGYTVHTGSLETAPKPQEPYDLIVGWMVVEHLHDPILSLKKLQTWVHSDGWLVFSIPNAASLEFKLFRSAWYALHLPNHLYHYTPKTIRHVLENSGWRMEKVFHHRSLSNVVASIGYVLQEQGYKNKLSQALIDFAYDPGHKRILLYPLAYLLSLFGQTGGMTIWARKLPN